MRKLVVPLVVLLALLILAAPAFSQLTTGAIKSKVAFDFQVGKTVLPAGEYSFTVDTQTNRMHIRNIATGERISVFTRDIIDNSTPTDNRLVFLKEGDRYVLHRVWSEQAGHVHDIVHGTEVAEL